ncbi:PREDICTED: uncharacterized protein C1orf141 homolog [Elephantulus edwardii]|uniref:uncharacterized protein C1orf141 homolog n=1 Tax=Elephantulus edwardii TaxID=28737 RepID=UPI0003F0E0ED|nr:PREDICTED: uncharacterized protein C1orf141 homolog [Elephantulus edwardii]
MAEKLLKKLEILDDQAKIIFTQREKINRSQSGGTKKTLKTPLTFDFQLELDQPFVKQTLKTVSKTTEDTLNNIKKQKRYVSFKDKPEYIKRPSEKSNLRPYFVPTNAKHQENKLSAQTKHKPLEGLDSVDHLENYVTKRKKYSSQVNYFTIKESRSMRNDQLSEHCAVGKKTLLPLSFEDELKKPNAKIISIDSSKKEISQTEQSHSTNPLIFHNSEYIQMLFLTQKKFLAQHTGNENIYPDRRTNLVLQKNCRLLNSLTNVQPIIPNLREIGPKSWRKKSRKVEYRVVEDETKIKTNKEVLENGCLNKPCNFPQTSSNVTKKIVDFFDKVITQEMNTRTGKLDRMFSTMKSVNTHKFSTSTSKCSKPFKKCSQSL